MKKLFVVLTVIICLFNSSIFIQAQSNDRISGSESIVVPENIKSMLQQIKIAEDNEDWEAYYNLRGQIISAWEEVNPQVANIYKRTNNVDVGNADLGPAQGTDDFQSNQLIDSRWGDDLMVHQGIADDISLVSAGGDTLYLSVLKRNFGSSLDTVYIYRSADGGNSWSQFQQLFFPGETAQCELLDFWGVSGPSYLLMFYRYIPSGLLWSTRFAPDGSFTNSLVVSNSVEDFSVDRNYPATNYRAIVLFDSSGVIHSIRSEPSSYATVWQDNHELGLFGVDVGMAYGFNGSVYTTFNGGSSGNLYVWPNYNYADPTGWVIGSQITIEQGVSDTTKQAELIASREDTSSQTVAVVYTHLNINTENLKWARKTGGSGWSAPMGWVINSTLDFKHNNLYCRRTNLNDNFQGVFARSELGNLSPRQIRYKKYDGSFWSGSIQVTDNGINTTGIQNPVVIELPSGNAAFAFAGSGGSNVYFDREDWISDVQPLDNKIPDTYSLYQNYPNPFNPSTNIKYSVPELSFVNIKIYNLLGQVIAELVNEELQGGNYEVNFDATNLSSGIYFYRFQAGNFVETKKMTLMK